MEPIEKHVEGSQLLACYGALLTEAQQEMMSLYYNEDLSLQEIADAHGISRQGVHDLLSRTLKKLGSYEDRLHLLARSARRSERLTQCAALAGELPASAAKTRLVAALRQMLEEEEQP